MSEIEDIRQSARAGQLVVVTGAGTSLSLASQATPSFNWPKLLENAFRFAEKSGKIDEHQHQRWSDTISSGDLDELLGAAEFVTRKLDGKSGLLYARWLESVFSRQNARSGSQMREALNCFKRGSVPICTLNYDTLIERCTKLPSISMLEHRKVLAWSRKETEAVLHLHGIWNEPQTIVLGVSDYKDATSDDFRNNLQRALSTFNRLLFVGCGDTLYDPNLSSLLSWMRETLGPASLQHYALVRDSEVDGKLRDPIWQGLVAPVGYGKAYDDLPSFIMSKIMPPAPGKRPAKRNQPSADNEILQHYRRYLVSDCGKMTIEGVRADADTAKQKFDLEKLFVPLAVDPVPPDFSGTEAAQERKIKDWKKRNSATLPFGLALAKAKKLALLALPGGGKTLLLKRLAVAYADSSRMANTDDHLPNLDLLPVLIRCREWRDHINLPVSAIISKISEITGNQQLKGLFEALQPRLKAGNVLLLVDGLDEIHNDADRTTFVENLERFLEEYSRVRMVVTSREAGFALVAPSLMRFCTRWRISPLSDDAVRKLCAHWHLLMDGPGVEPQEETRMVVEAILSNNSLRRLAENPLLLTMLLVVKHGYGRLPPDRVSLYERAVEVLLDTWNIRGHAALNPREAVPQLAYLAFRLTEQGKQTATEKELLTLIEECRREVPMVRHYAKDSPSDFLKRVELRSSLVVEAGRSVENGRTVPFYQFRHLTFQEYMSAIAIVEGHYSGFSERDTILTPFGGSVLSDKWKEVVPMAAVLSKKRSSPLINELLLSAEHEAQEAISTSFLSSKYLWNSAYRLPSSVSRIIQCIVEEAELSQANLNRALRVIAILAHGCQTQENWSALMSGPFGADQFEAAWEIHVSEQLPRQSWIKNTVLFMAFHRKPLSYWTSPEGVDELRTGLLSPDLKERSVAAATACGCFWKSNDNSVFSLYVLQPYLEANTHRDTGPESVYCFWALALMFSRTHDEAPELPEISSLTATAIVDRWFNSMDAGGDDIASFTVTATGLVGPDWKPAINEHRANLINRALSRPVDELRRHSDWEAAALLAYRGNVTIVGREAVKAMQGSYLGAFRHADTIAIARHLGATDEEVRSIQEHGRITRKRRVSPSNKALHTKTLA